jgi:hypothetical protein
MPEAIRQTKITFNQLANTYIPFALLMVLALIGPEQTQNPDLYRTKLTIWATTVLLIPTLCLYMFRGVSQPVENYWRLMWTFSFLAFCVHFYYGTFVEMGGFGDTFVKQGPWIAGPNFFLTMWWMVDVILVWSLKSRALWVSIQRLGLNVFIFGVFVITNIFLRNEAIWPLGVLFTVVVVLCFGIRMYIAPSRLSELKP